MKKIFLLSIMLFAFLVGNVQTAKAEDYYLVGPQANGKLNKWLKMTLVPGTQATYEIMIPARYPKVKPSQADFVFNIDSVFSGSNDDYLPETEKSPRSETDYNNRNHDAYHAATAYMHQIVEATEAIYNANSALYNTDGMQFAVISGTNLAKYELGKAWADYSKDLIVPVTNNTQKYYNKSHDNFWVSTAKSVSGVLSIPDPDDTSDDWYRYPWEIRYNVTNPKNNGETLLEITPADGEIANDKIQSFRIQATSSAPSNITDNLCNALDGSYKLTIDLAKGSWSMTYYSDRRTAYLVVTDPETNAWTGSNSSGHENAPYDADMTYTFAEYKSDGAYKTDGQQMYKNANVYCSSEKDYLVLMNCTPDDKSVSFYNYLSSYKVNYSSGWSHMITLTDWNIVIDASKHELTEGATSASKVDFANDGSFNDCSIYPNYSNNNMAAINFTNENAGSDNTSAYETLHLRAYWDGNGDINSPKVDIELEQLDDETYRAYIENTGDDIFDKTNMKFYFQGFDGDGDESHDFVWGEDVTTNTYPIPTNPNYITISADNIENKLTWKGIVTTITKTITPLTYDGSVDGINDEDFNGYEILFKSKLVDGVRTYYYTIRKDEVTKTITVKHFGNGIGEHEYLVSFSDNNDYRLPKGVKSYAVNDFSISGSADENGIYTAIANLKEIGYIPANCGVMLEVTASDINDEDSVKLNSNGTYSVILSPISDAMKNYYSGNITPNYLEPSISKTYINASSFDNNVREYRNFIFSRFKYTNLWDSETNTADDDYLGFFRVIDGSYSGANKAYLHMPVWILQKNVQTSSINLGSTTAAKMVRLSFSYLDDEEETTGIKNVNAEKVNDDAYYTLTGVKVTKPSKGVYIHNGKKVVIK